MLRALHYSHTLLSQLIQRFSDGLFIDATLGNGNDTLFILQQEAFQGQVIGFDIQDLAIQNANGKIMDHPKAQLATLIHDSHTTIAQHIGDATIHGAIFNLGYLPGGDHDITTQFDSTIEALSQIRERLAKGGQILIVVYSGHPQGAIEKEKLFEHLGQWPQEMFQVLQYEFINQRNQPPMLLVVERIK